MQLVGRAATVFKRVPEPWELCRLHRGLRERFDPSSKRELYLAELLGHKKHRAKDWATFAEDLKTLVDKTYPELQDDVKEQLALTHYLRQLEQQQLAFSVKQRRPKSVDAASSSDLGRTSQVQHRINNGDYPPSASQ